MLLCGIAGCDASNRHAQIVEGYAAATCLAFSAERKIAPRTKEWQSVVHLHDGSEVVVSGAQAVGGRIVLTFPGPPHPDVLINAGDYIYPSDVRLDARSDFLYVKAAGVAGGMFQQTWLFEYDLDHRQMVTRARIAPGILPAECVETE